MWLGGLSVLTCGKARHDDSGYGGNHALARP